MAVKLAIAPEAEIDIASAYAWYRRVLVRRFPYAIFYEISGDAVTVFAVFHTARDPGKWRSRLP